MNNPIGLMLNGAFDPDRLRGFETAVGLGFKLVQTAGIPESWLQGLEMDKFVEAIRKSGVTVATMFVGFDGQSYADLDSIARTVGLVNPEFREHRCMIAGKYSNLAQEIGARSLAVHLGFLPKGSGNADYISLIENLRDILNVCLENGQELLIETGQEPAQRLRKLIEDVNRSNLGVNFDPANFILYGTDDPPLALEELAPWIKAVHCKDGFPPQRAGQLGEEVPAGIGAVNFKKLMARLVGGLGYQGPFFIEREGGADPVQDALSAREFLSRL